MSHLDEHLEAILNIPFSLTEIREGSIHEDADWIESLLHTASLGTLPEEQIELSLARAYRRKIVDIIIATFGRQTTLRQLDPAHTLHEAFLESLLREGNPIIVSLLERTIVDSGLILNEAIEDVRSTLFDTFAGFVLQQRTTYNALYVAVARDAEEINETDLQFHLNYYLDSKLRI